MIVHMAPTVCVNVVFFALPTLRGHKLLFTKLGHQQSVWDWQVAPIVQTTHLHGRGGRCAFWMGGVPSHCANAQAKWANISIAVLAAWGNVQRTLWRILVVCRGCCDLEARWGASSEVHVPS